MPNLEEIDPFKYFDDRGDKSIKNSDLVTAPHDKKIEWAALAGTGGVIFLSFASIWAVSFISHNNSVDGGKAKEQLVSFASSTGTTALGALVAVLARKRRSD